MTSDDIAIAARFSERFNSPRERGQATHDLAAMGPAAIPVLEAILSGTAKNPFGVAYLDLGQPLMLSFVTIGLLGTAARGLERYVLDGVRNGHIYAVEALPRIGPFSEDAIAALAQCLGQGLLGMEAACALREQGALSHPSVAAVAATNPKVAWEIEWLRGRAASQKQPRDG